jgi:hypothetical protein
LKVGQLVDNRHLQRRCHLRCQHKLAIKVFTLPTPSWYVLLSKTSWNVKFCRGQDQFGEPVVFNIWINESYRFVQFNRKSLPISLIVIPPRPGERFYHRNLYPSAVIRTGRCWELGKACKTLACRVLGSLLLGNV